MAGLAHRAAPSFEDRNMNSKQKRHGGNETRAVARKKVVTVDEDSLQSKAPGAGPSARGNEQTGRNRNLSTASPGSQQGGVGERGGVGAQQSGWSARQQAERMKARAEEARRGEPQQSGYGGAEQNQHAGSQESPTGPPGASQSGASAAPRGQGGAESPPSDSGSKRAT
jgi:hypothetical protein